MENLFSKFEEKAISRNVFYFSHCTLNNEIRNVIETGSNEGFGDKTRQTVIISKHLPKFFM